MDKLSSPINLQAVPKSFNTNHHLHHHKATPLSHHRHPSSTTKTTTTSSISTLPQKDNFTPLFTYHPQKRASSPSSPSLSSLKPPQPPPPPRASIHRRAASGYAAALLDISQSNNNLLKVEKDVRRLLKVVFGSKSAQVNEFMKNEWVEEKAKREVLKNFMMKGKFDGNLVRLINILVDKGNSVELVKEVLEEFINVFHQLTIGIAHAPTTRLAMS